MAVYLFGFDFIFDLYFFRLALFTSLSGLYIRFILHFINSEIWVKSYSQFSLFLFLPLTGYIITSAISDNIALSLGMVGALSIVRFRTPIKNPSELVIYFVLITVGIVTNVDPSKSVIFLMLITLSSIGIEIYKFITKKLNLEIFDFNELNVYLDLTLQKEINELTSLKEFSHMSVDEDKCFYRFVSNSLETVLDIKNSIDKNLILSYSIDNNIS